MKGLKNMDANKFSLRMQKNGDVQKSQVVQPAKKPAASRKENEDPKKNVRTMASSAKVVASVPVTTTSASMMKKFAEVGDVDCQPGRQSDCLLMSCYVKEIFTYLRQLEVSAAAVRPDFLRSPARLEITPRMRSILLDWLAQVHQRFTLLPETLYLTYHIVDAYLSSDAGPDVKKGQFQLLGVTAMLLASKYEEIYPPNVQDFVYVTDNAYTASDVRAMEWRLLSQLGCFLGYPLPIQFLRRYSQVSDASPAVHEAAKYLAELARVDYAAAHLPPSGLAAAACCLARQLLQSSPSSSSSSLSSEAANGGWTDTLEVFSGYGSRQLAPAVRLVAAAAVAASESVKYTAIRKKYSNQSISLVATWPELRSDNPALRSAAGIKS